MKTEVIPVNGRVLVRPIATETERKTNGGLFVPDSAAGNACIGEVVEKDAKEWPGEITSSVQCMYLKGGGVVVTIDGEDLFLVQKEAILAFLSS